MKRLSLFFYLVAMILCGCGGASTFAPAEPGTLGLTVDDCTSDADGDGTVDCDDGCPDDEAKTEPGECGCGVSEIDHDADGTPTCIDACPDDPEKIEPGACGCGVSDEDDDEDGFINCDDDCPDDADKADPGECGCGVSEIDHDGDGTPTCVDACPNDPDKTVSGMCGCGTPDADADSDGTPDCNDACPDDPAKTQPGTCGCGTPDTDTDGDGAPDCEDDCPDNPGVINTGALTTFTVTIVDPEAAYVAFYDGIESNLIAASEDWASHLVAAKDVTIEIQVLFDQMGDAIAAARSLSTVQIGTDGGLDLFESGIATEIRTGTDPNGTAPDAEVVIGIDFLTGNCPPLGCPSLWFDPDPWARAAPVPSGRYDAFSVLLHEMGHALAYNGWRCADASCTIGELPFGFLSKFDELTLYDGATFTFVGPLAVEAFGGPVPLDSSIFHLALDSQVMNATGSVGLRHEISPLDLAILTDVGLPVRTTQGTGGDDCDSGAPALRRAPQPIRLGPTPTLRPIAVRGKQIAD